MSLLFLNKSFLMGVEGVAIAGTGASVGIYYANQGNAQPKSPGEPGTGGPNQPREESPSPDGHGQTEDSNDSQPAVSEPGTSIQINN